MYTYRVNISRHGSAGEYLSHDLAISPYRSVLGHLNLRVLLDRVAWRPSIIAIHARVDFRAFHVLSLILLTGYVGDRVLEHPSVGGIGIAAVAGACAATVDQCLNGRDDVALLSYGKNIINCVKSNAEIKLVDTFRLNFKAVGDRRKCRMGPARTAYQSKKNIK